MIIISNSFFEVILIKEIKEESIKEIINLYWSYDFKQKKFLSIEAITEKYQLKQREINTIIKEYCRAFRLDNLCQECKKPAIYYHSKKALISKSNKLEGYRYINSQYSSYKEEFCGIFCDKCWLKKEKQRLDYQIINMNKAIKDDKINELNRLENKVLYESIHSNKLEDARRKTGLSHSDFSKIINKFIDFGLIVIDKENDKCSYHPYMPNIVESKNDSRRIVSSVFGSVKARDLFFALKQHFDYIYPEIPLAAFIDQNCIKDLLDASWKFYYFL